MLSQTFLARNVITGEPLPSPAGKGQLACTELGALDHHQHHHHHHHHDHEVPAGVGQLACTELSVLDATLGRSRCTVHTATRHLVIMLIVMMFIIINQ